MIQRIQTLYLLIIVVLQAILLSSNLGQNVETVFKIKDIPILAALACFTTFIPAVSMFLYKKRMLQIRFNIFNSILLLVLQGFVIYYITQHTQDPAFKFSYTLAFPVVSLILSILAIRNILRDELLIKSLNRIR